MTIDKILSIYWLFKYTLTSMYIFQLKKDLEISSSSSFSLRVLFDLDLINDCISVEYTKN